jgi:hypothetical protein
VLDAIASFADAARLLPRHHLTLPPMPLAMLFFDSAARWRSAACERRAKTRIFFMLALFTPMLSPLSLFAAITLSPADADTPHYARHLLHMPADFDICFVAAPLAFSARMMPAVTPFMPLIDTFSMPSFSLHYYDYFLLPPTPAAATPPMPLTLMPLLRHAASPLRLLLRHAALFRHAAMPFATPCHADATPFAFLSRLFSSAASQMQRSCRPPRAYALAAAQAGTAARR